jgi:hypothetical protein
MSNPFVKQFNVEVPSVLNLDFEGTAMTPVDELPTEVTYFAPSSSDKAGEAFEKMAYADAFSQAEWTQIDKNTTVVSGIEQDVLVLDYSTNEVCESAEKLSSQELPASALQQSAVNDTQRFKVTLSASPGRNGQAETLIFDVMPRISESRQATYSDFTPMHHPGQIQKYQSSQSRSWSMTAKLISRNSTEASRNLETINIIRSWVMPFYGQGTAQDGVYSKYLGAPPPIITLSAYGDKMIGPVKTVMTQYSWDFPNDVDYIKTLNNTPFPVLIELTLNLTETFSPAEYSGFNLNAYKQGNMQQAFKAIARADRPLPKQQAAPMAPSAAAVAEPTVVSTTTPSKSKVVESAKNAVTTKVENLKTTVVSGAGASNFPGVY